MIRINLLPAEKRKAERTPLPRLTLLMATAAAATLIIAYIALILIRIRNTNNEINDINGRLNSPQMKANLALFDKLTAEQADLTRKVTEIRDLTDRKMKAPWWRAINALWDVINAHPRVWIDDIKALDERAIQGAVKQADPDDKTAPPAGIQVRCHVSGDEVAEMTKFRTALKNNAVLKEWLTFININVDWKIDDETEFKSNSISFNISMWGPTKPLEKKGVQPPKPPAGGGTPVSPPPATQGAPK